MRINSQCLVIIIFIIPFISSAQWIQHQTPQNMEINATGFFKHGESDYLVTKCGVYTKQHNEENWQLFHSIILESFYLHGDTLVATDQYEADGVSFDLFYMDMNQSKPEPVKISWESNTNVIFKAENHWLTGSDNFGFSYYDNGRLWTNNGGLPYDSVYNWYSGEYDYEWYVYALNEMNGSIYSGTHKGLYTLDSLGGIWERAVGLPEHRVNFIKRFDTTLLAGIENEIYLSNTGIEWTLLYQADSEAIDLLINEGEYYIVINGLGIVHSNNLVEWSYINDGLSDLNINFIDESNQQLVCGTMSTGFNYNHYGFWEEFNDNIICTEIRSFAVSSSGIYCNSSQSVWYAPDAYDFEEITPPVDEKYFGSVSTIGDTVILTYKTVVSNPYFERDNFIIFSSDHGESWETPEHQPPYWGDDTYRIIIGNNGFYAYEDDQMFYTEDMGTTWQEMLIPQQFCNDYSSALEYNNTPFAAACGDNDLLKWEDNAWQLSADGIPDNETVERLFACKEGIFAYLQPNQIYVSIDSGNSWNVTSSNLPDLIFLRYSTYYGNAAFITSPVGVFYTDDLGKHWRTLNKGLPAKKTYYIDIYKDTLFVNTRLNGLWKMAIRDIHLSVNNLESSNNYLNIFPNPANNKFSISNGNIHSNYQIVVRNLKGQLLLQKNIRNNETVDVQHLELGMYILTAQTNGKIQTGKLIISR